MTNVERANVQGPMANKTPRPNDQWGRDFRLGTWDLVLCRPLVIGHFFALAVFIDGCFWHACPSHSNMPVQNRKFWKAKLDTNQRRDRLVRRTLESRGWRVLRIWEHELSRRDERQLLRRIGAYARAD